MGGRGRRENQQDEARFFENVSAALGPREYVHSDHWSWVETLSPDRLENYGHVMARKEQDGSIQMEQAAFLYELRKEHRHRTGELPLWGDHDLSRQANERFQVFRPAPASAPASVAPVAPVASVAPVAPDASDASDDVQRRVADAVKSVRKSSSARVSRAVDSVQGSVDPDTDRVRKDARNARDRARRAARRAAREAQREYD